MLIKQCNSRDKVADHQQGYAYLTSLRVCYVDEREPRKNSVGVNLQEIDRIEHQVSQLILWSAPASITHTIQAGFLKSSPKVILIPSLSKRTRTFSSSADSNYLGFRAQSSPSTRTASPLNPNLQSTSQRSTHATWICPICSFSNLIPPGFDATSPQASHSLRPCQNCGVVPSMTVVLKAAIAAASRPNPSRRDILGSPALAATINQSLPVSVNPEASIACPRCTYSNSRFLVSCEICGAPLKGERGDQGDSASSPELTPADHGSTDPEGIDSVKLSFRAGGDKAFFEKLKHAQTQKKWLLRAAPPIPRPTRSFLQAGNEDIMRLKEGVIERPRSTPVGIAQLESRGLELRRNNEAVIGNAFEDLQALMASAQDIVALAENFAIDSGRTSSDARSIVSESAAALGMVTTRDKLGSGADTLYLSELSRNLAEFLTDDKKGILRGEGGIISLVDLWAVFNRSRNGVELVSPAEFHKAAQLWEKLGLPIRLRRFKSGLLAVGLPDWNDERVLRLFKIWLEELRRMEPNERVPWDWALFGRGIDAQETAQRFGWSIGVATEELEMAEDSGLLCREERIEGMRYWGNYILHDSI